MQILSLFQVYVVAEKKKKTTQKRSAFSLWIQLAILKNVIISVLYTWQVLNWHLLNVPSDFRRIFPEDLAFSKKKKKEKSVTFQRKCLSPVSCHSKLLEFIKFKCRSDPNSSRVTMDLYWSNWNDRVCFPAERAERICKVRFRWWREDDAAARAPLAPSCCDFCAFSQLR